MSGTAWLSLIALAGWLVLALSSYRAHRIGAGKTVVLATAWAAIFLLVTGIIVMMGA